MDFIYMEMDIYQGLLDVIMIGYRVNHFMHTLYYKNIMFHYSTCQLHGHLKINCLYKKKNDELRGTHLMMSPSYFKEEFLSRV